MHLLLFFDIPYKMISDKIKSCLKSEFQYKHLSVAVFSLFSTEIYYMPEGFVAAIPPFVLLDYPYPIDHDFVFSKNIYNRINFSKPLQFHFSSTHSNIIFIYTICPYEYIDPLLIDVCYFSIDGFIFTKFK